jgi:hypothetical protein
MNKLKLEIIQELSIVFNAPDCNPILFTPNFLKGSGIIPGDWQLAHQPQLSPQAAQISFTNGISIIAQPTSLVLIQSLGRTDDLQQVKIDDLAHKHLKALPNLEYQTIVLNPRSIVTFPDQNQQVAHEFIFRLLAPAPWQNFDDARLQAKLNLIYTFQKCELNLNISEISLRQEGLDPVGAVFFSGSFAKPIKGDSAGENFEQMAQHIDAWRDLTMIYRKVLQQFFK